MAEDMSDHLTLDILVPSRGRPENVRRLMDACMEHSLGACVIVGVDADDSTYAEYERVLGDFPQNVLVVTSPGSNGMVAALNEMLNASDADYVAFLGDDHVPSTPGWDQRLCQAIKAQGGGLAYGNDLLQGESLPTAIVMDGRIPRALGYMAPPVLKHLYVDNVWKIWGEYLGKLAYLDDVIVEHLHPGAGKADWDEQYHKLNSTGSYSADAAAFERYRGSDLAIDVEKMRELYV